MFFDSNASPPSPDGFNPQPGPEPRITPTQERTIMRVIGLLVLVMFLGPFAGSSVIVALVALVRSIFAVSR